MIAIIYPRVSTEEQAKSGYSLAAQRDACQARALALGYTQENIVEVCEDGVSGDILERPGLTRVRELVRQGGVGHFICLDPDRFSRKLTHQLLVTDELEHAGVQLEFINFEWRDTPEGRLFYTLRGAIAEFEKEKIKERTMQGKRQHAKEGGAEAKAALARLRSRLAGINEERDRLLVLYQKAIIPLGKIEEKLAELSAQESKLIAAEVSLQERADAATVPGLVDLRELISALRTGLEDENPTQRQFILRCLVATVMVREDGIDIVARIPDREQIGQELDKE